MTHFFSDRLAIHAIYLSQNIEARFESRTQSRCLYEKGHISKDMKKHEGIYYLRRIKTRRQIYDVHNHLLKNINKPYEIVRICRSYPHI